MNSVYVSVDIEGIWGVASAMSTTKGNEEYCYARENMINETNILIGELLKNGVKNILVNDSHGSMDNLIPKKLNPNVSIVTSNSKYKELGMMEGISRDFDASIFIGYHTREGTEDSILNHTMASKYVHKILLNDIEVGETMLNAYLSYYYNVPVILVAGDDKYINQSLKDFNNNIITIETKKAINREVAINIPYNKLVNQYEEKVRQALNMKEYYIDKKDSHEIKIIFHTEDIANFVSRIPTVERIDSKTVKIKNKDYLKIYKLYRFCVTIADLSK